MSIIARTSSSVSCSILFTSCEMRKPSKKCRNGTRASSVAAWAIRAMSCASCTEADDSMRPARAAAGHHVAVVAEDRQGMGGDGAGGDVEHRRGELAGDLEHVGDHQQQALRGREGGGQRPGLQRAVHRPGGPRLALHFDHDGHGAEDVLAAGSRPGVGQLAQSRRRGDRINRHDLVAEMGDIGRRFIAVDGHEASLFHGSFSSSK